MAKKKKYYAVATGRTRGIFTAWFGPRGAETQVRGVAGAVYKGFATLKEAEGFLADHPAGIRPKYKPSSSRRAKAGRSVSHTDPTPDDTGRVVIYTDGGALSNPGPGGYGVVIQESDHTRELSAGFRLTTNNRMEMMACIAALSAFKEPTAIALYSDSRYVINGVTKGWARKWKANNWMRTATEPALNPDLWQTLLDLVDRHDVVFRWVKGHAGIQGNERCDELATRAASAPDLPPDTVYENTLKPSNRRV